MKKVILIYLLIAVGAYAEERKALLYKIGNTSEVVYTQTTEIKDLEDGQKSWVSSISDSNGVKVMTEKAVFKDGKMLSQKIEQLQINEAYELKVEGNKATFQEFEIKADGPLQLKESNSVTIDDSFVTGPVTDLFLQKNWKSLVAGETVAAQFGVFELRKTVNFEFKKTNDDGKVIEIKMRPANMFINMLVDPIFLYLDKSTQKMIRFKGRTPLREKIKGKWKPFDSEILYPNL